MVSFAFKGALTNLAAVSVAARALCAEHLQKRGHNNETPRPAFDELEPPALHF